MMKLFIKEKGVNMDLDALPIIKRLELSVKIAKDRKNKRTRTASNGRDESRSL